jgi:hypothetical protein
MTLRLVQPDFVVDRTTGRTHVMMRVDVRLALAGMCLTALVGFGLACLILGF